MRSVDNETRQTMNSRRNFVNYATMTLSDGTVLELKPSDFRVAGQSFTDDWVDGDSFQLGTAIGKTATLLLDNTDGRTEEIANGIADVYPHGKFSEYDFYMAYFTLDVCLPEAYHYGGELRDQMIRIGTFTVTTPTSHGSTIEIVGVDNMYLFDRSFDECDLDFTSGPTLLNILNKCCSDVGIFLVTQSFDNQNIRIYTRPEDTTYRQVVSWIAQIAGCNAVITETGDLKLKSYDMSALNGLYGGSFVYDDVTEKQYQDTLTWNGVVDSYYWTGYRITFNPTQYGDIQDVITEPGIYDISNIKIENVLDPTNFNASYRVQESIDHGSTWTLVETGTLSIGDNRINYKVNISREDKIIYRVQVGQDNTNPNASKFDATFYIRMFSDGDVADGGYFDNGSPYYVSGDSYDGGDFTTPLGFHNLTSVNGTSISTDDIQFTGVSVVSEGTSAHYPNDSNWDYYAMEITENPFVIDNESTIAQSIYNRISGLKFRPFTTSSVQDPTIEAGDPCVVYDVKGNMYNSIITNVVFKTSGMTELSCNAEPPAKQGSRYSAPASVRKVANSMTTYQSQTAHFNEIASAALGYFRTDIVDPQTGAITTYLHDQPTLESSQNVVKVANGIVAISEDGGTTYEQGYETSTGTMLLNLIYAHGITSDWINTGTLTVGGVNNIDGVIHVYNDTVIAPYTWNPSDVSAGDSKWISFQFFTAQTYRLVKFTISNVSDVSLLTGIVWQWAVSTDSGAHWSTISSGDVTDEGDYYIDYPFTVTSTTQYMLWVGTYSVTADQKANLTFDRSLTYTSINTTIDKDGVNIRKGTIQLGAYDSGKRHHPFEVDDDGNLHAENGEIAGLTTDWWEKGWTYNGPLSVYYNDSWHDGVLHYFKISAYGGLNVGRYMDSSNADVSSACWSNLWWVQSFGMFRIDYGSSNDPYKGILVTNVGNNKYYDPGSTYAYMRVDGVHVVSDRRSKKAITDLPKTLCKNLILNSRPVRFKFRNGDTDEYHYGFIAQEIEEVAPENNSVIEHNTDSDVYSMNYQEMIAPAIKVIQMQQEEIDDLKARIKILEDIVNTKLK